MLSKKRLRIAVVGVLIVLGLTAGVCTPDKNSAQEQGQRQTEAVFSQQSRAVPYPVDQLKDSLERRNLKERLLRTNRPDVLGYVYLMSFGKIIGYYTIKGKVSSTQSQMTTDQLAVACHYQNACVVNAPGDDGSYGPNEEGIFFFTTEGAFVTTSLDYIWSDVPLPLDVPRFNKKK